MKAVIIGGVAAGFSAASQIKRQSPKSPIWISVIHRPTL